MNRSFPSSLAAVRTRSSPGDTLARRGVRRVLARPVFSSAPSLGSTSSDLGRPTPFAGFPATMEGSDFSRPFIIGFGSSQDPEVNKPPYRTMSTGEDLGAVLAGLERASRDRLAEHWAEYFGAPPPPRTSRSLMIRAVAYKLQERELGGLSAATRRLLYRQGPAPVRRRRALSRIVSNMPSAASRTGRTISSAAAARWQVAAVGSLPQSRRNPTGPIKPCGLGPAGPFAGAGRDWR